MPDLNLFKAMPPGITALNFTPFLLFLFLIAFLPFVPLASRWWEQIRNKFFVSMFFGLLGIVLWAAQTHDLSRVFHACLDYGDFIFLIGALYVVSGGIHILGVYEGFPFVNTLYLAIGAVLSNVFGTTGASLLLIRPLLHANRHRKHKTHIVLFFIFIVANCGACLVPLGPPLYLGYLRGIPFLWTMNLLPQCALTVGLLLVLFHFIDGRYFEKEEVETKGRMSLQIHQSARKIQVRGGRNIIFIAMILGVVLFSGYVVSPWAAGLWNEETADIASKGFQIAAFGILALCSFWFTPKGIHELNRLHFAPLQEVAVLFFGIFGTLIFPLAIMEAKADTVGLSQPWQYFWASGLLSAFLDNAPTYLNYTVLAATRNGIASNHLGELAARFPILLAAISCGASFMGALTYIGNGPNLMVKAIAEHHRIKMPSFGGYLLWSSIILIPIFVLVTCVFF